MSEDTTVMEARAQVDLINSFGRENGARIVFLDLFPSHYQYSRPFIERLVKKRPVVLIVTDKEHPAYTEPGRIEGLHIVWLDPKWLGFALHWLRLPYLVTPASHLHPSAIFPELNTVHIYHSLVSMHAVYGDNAFDAYTHFLTCGPHHVREIAAIKEARGLPPAQVFKVGYPRADVIATEYVMRGRRSGPVKTILVAPSWHPDNLLALYSEDLCKSVLRMGYDVIVRPHPHLYERDAVTMGKLREVEARSPDKVRIENPGTEFSSFWQADVMVSDWSGVAYEFAFATERPVLFINSPRKVNSPGWESHGIPLMEIEARSKVGIVISHPSDLQQGLTSLVAVSTDEWGDRIRKARGEYLFNFGRSAEVGANVLNDIVVLEDLLVDAPLLPDRHIQGMPKLKY